MLQTSLLCCEHELVTGEGVCGTRKNEMAIVRSDGPHEVVN